MAWVFVVGIVVVVMVFALLRSDSSPTKGVYRHPGKWSFLKYWAFFVLFKLRQHQNKRKSASGENAGYGMRSRNSIEEMDKAQDLPAEHPQAVDAVYFNGANREGGYFVGATARRHDKLTQTLLYIRVPRLGLLELPSLPDTSLFREEEMTFAANGFKIQPVEPMKKWKLTFNGKMRLIRTVSEQEEVHVEFSFDWTAGPGYFDFDTDMHTHAMCEAMSRELWSKDFFERLKEAHQTHYEQFGELRGKLKIGELEDIDFSVQGVRDHSYGNLRDWKMLHRYAIQYLTLENGTSICAGLICMPKTLSRLPIGYVCHPDGKIDTLEWIDFEFYHENSGNDGQPPKELHFRFKAGKVEYDLECTVVQDPIFYMGYEWEARIHERMCKFVVNGVAGWGISEWDYRNWTGRPERYKTKVTTQQ